MDDDLEDTLIETIKIRASIASESDIFVNTLDIIEEEGQREANRCRERRRNHSREMGFYSINVSRDWIFG